MEEARRAVDAGADALMVLPPFFVAPSMNAILRHIHDVATAVSVPVIAQYAPLQTGVTLHSNRIFRTFDANKKQKSPGFNNLHDLSNHTFTLFPKGIQVVDWDGFVRSFLFEAAPKVRKIRFECRATPTDAYVNLVNLTMGLRTGFDITPPAGTISTENQIEWVFEHPGVGGESPQLPKFGEIYFDAAMCGQGLDYLANGGTDTVINMVQNNVTVATTTVETPTAHQDRLHRQSTNHRM